MELAHTDDPILRGIYTTLLGAVLMEQGCAAITAELEQCQDGMSETEQEFLRNVLRKIVDSIPRSGALVVAMKCWIEASKDDITHRYASVSITGNLRVRTQYNVFEIWNWNA